GVKLLMERFGRSAIQPNHFKSHDRMTTPVLLTYVFICNSFHDSDCAHNPQCLKTKCRMSILRIAIQHFVRYFERAKLRSCAKNSGSDSPFRYCPLTGTAKYAVLAPVTGSIIALPVISPLSFMSLAVSR